MLDSAIIATRLRSLRKETGLSIGKLADALYDKYKLSILPESLRKYECLPKKSEESHPNLRMRSERLLILADYYGVSTDYILGKTDIKSPDSNIHAIAEYTGLSEVSIRYLHHLKNADTQTTSDLFEILEQDPVYFYKASPSAQKRLLEEAQKQYGAKALKGLAGYPDIDRMAGIQALHMRKDYIRNLIKALNKRYGLVLNAINALLSSNEQLHLLEEIGKYVSPDLNDLGDHYPISANQESRVYTTPDYLTDTMEALLLERRLRIITHKVEQLRETVLDSAN